MSTQSWWLIHSPLATHDTPVSRFIIWAEAFFFFSVMWQLVFNSLHGNGQNKPRACLLQGRCTTSSGPWNLFICVGENIRRPRCCFFHLFIHFKIEWRWFDKKNFFKCYNVSPWPRKEHENDNILVFSSNLFLIKQQMWQILISNPQPYSLQRPCLQSLYWKLKKNNPDNNLTT